MNNDWFLQLAVGCIVAALAFFLKRHITSVDKKIDSLTTQTKETHFKLSEIETNLNDVHRDMLVRLSGIKIPKEVDHKKVENINVNVAIIRNQVNNDLVPRLRRIEEDYGRIIILEDTVKKEAQKLRTLYQTVDYVFTKQGVIKKKPE